MEIFEYFMLLWALPSLLTLMLCIQILRFFCEGGLESVDGVDLGFMIAFSVLYPFSRFFCKGGLESVDGVDLGFMIAFSVLYPFGLFMCSLMIHKYYGTRLTRILLSDIRFFKKDS